MKTAIVFGAAGFIGSHLVKKIAALGWQVDCIDNLSNGDIGRFQHLNPGLSLKTMDCRLYESALKSADFVFDLAYINGTRNFYTRASEILKFAGGSVFKSIELAQRLDARLIYFSTPEIYGEPDVIPTSENVVLRVEDITNKRWSYSIGKIFSEAVLHSLGHNRLNFVVVRPNNAYGPFDKDHVIPDLFRKLSRDLSRLEILGAPTDSRAYCYVEDMVEQIILVALLGETACAYNVGSSVTTTLEDLVGKMVKIVRVNPTLDWRPAMEGSPRRRCPDLSKVSKLGSLKWTPLDVGLERVYASLTPNV